MHVDLLELPYFEGMNVEALVQLVDRMRPCRYPQGTVISQEGSRDPTPLYIATSGRVLITKRGPEGADRNLAELECPTLFGEIELFCQIPPVCSAVALTDVEACALDRATFDGLFESSHPGILRFTYNVAKVVCHRLAIADEMLAQVLEDEDLCALRRQVWARMRGDEDPAWLRTTGVFRRPGT